MTFFGFNLTQKLYCHEEYANAAGFMKTSQNFEKLPAIKPT